jgi:hypothetical protein
MVAPRSQPPMVAQLRGMRWDQVETTHGKRFGLHAVDFVVSPEEITPVLIALVVVRGALALFPSHNGLAWVGSLSPTLHLLPPVIFSCTPVECFGRRRQSTALSFLSFPLDGGETILFGTNLGRKANKLPSPSTGGGAQAPVGRSRAEQCWGRLGSLLNAFQVRLDAAAPRARLVGWPGASPSFRATRRA